MLPTPDLSHLDDDDKLHVYDPAEDTFLLLDGLEKDTDQLRTQKPLICLEIGSGSGCVSAFLGSILGPTNALYLCTDINQRASVCTFATGKQNKVPLSPITCDLSKPLSMRLRRSVDIILFNPPYVPTDHEESVHAQGSAGIAGSWAGGLDGMEVTNRFLDNVGDLLSDCGKFYLVAQAQNNIPEICERMQIKFNLNSRIALQRRAGREHLFIICFSRS
ncbi:S-adenosyl-L-methionine-dependent methyltransferase [Boletus edulis BED1]|uniref:S-adenosyl-L-methionine-dependent methyltransferase n=1 Tax=Boletus edulis BED1 TaxID=1328754 RepID=A0AAD4C3E6_BOLED|nr:S-adenosyl-L-methionine-dependent methyltransferase [Boletus edulis BED1]